MSAEKTLTAPQLRAIASLLIDGSLDKAAGAAGVNLRTLYRWRADPAFQAGLRAAEAEAIAGLSRALAGLGGAAADALRDGLKPEQKITVRLRASEVVIGRLLALRELVDLEQRITALEQQLAERNTPAPG